MIVDPYYTPTTDDVAMYYEVGREGEPRRSITSAEFDRWLSAHDSDVRTAALDEAAEVSVRYATAPARDARDRITADDITFRIRALKEEKK